LGSLNPTVGVFASKQVIVRRFAAVFRVLPFINRLKAFGGSVGEDLLEKREAGGALALEPTAFDTREPRPDSNTPRRTT
jgi:hypothetical protein